MKRILQFSALFPFVLMLALASLPALADITDALYEGVIRITNTGGDASGVSANFSLDTEYFINEGYAAADLSDVAIQYNGVNILFMPGYAGNPWIFEVTTIGASQTLDYNLYCKGASGGKIVYFPGPAGMSVAANASLNIGSSGNFTWSGYFNPTSTGSLLNIPNAISVNGTGTGNVTVTISVITDNRCLSFDGNDYAANATAVAPSGANMTIEAWIYADGIGVQQRAVSCGSGTAPNNYWSLQITAANKINFVIGNNAANYCTYWTSTNSTVAGQWYRISATYNKDLVTRANVYVSGAVWGGADVGIGGNICQPNTYMVIGALWDGGAYIQGWTGDIDEVRISNIARTQAEAIAAYNGGVGLQYTVDANTISLWHCNEGAGGTTADAKGNNNLAITGATWVATSPMLSLSGVSITSPVISVGEHVFMAYLAGGFLGIKVDSSANTSVAYTASISAATSNLAWLSGNIMPYVNSIEVWKSGARTGYWYWEYGATFTDQSGNGNTGTPSFRTTSSDADVSAELTSFLPISIAEADDFTIIGALPELSPPPAVGMFSEGDSSHIPGADAANEMLNEGNVPEALWWFPFIYFGICIIGFIVYEATEPGPGEEGSLLTMAIVMEVLIAVAGIMAGPVPLWPAYLFPIPAMALITSKKHYSLG